MKVFLAVLLMFNIYEICAKSESCLGQKDVSAFIAKLKDVSSKSTDIYSLKADIADIIRDMSALLKRSGQVKWGDWGEWSTCDMSLCNIAHRQRPCLGEGAYELDPSRCSRFGGKNTEKKQCCDINEETEYRNMYSGNGTVPAYIIKATGSNIKVNEREKLSWVVSLKFKKSNASEYEHNCGGVILSNIWVLTAAHCITDTGCWDSTEKKVKCGMNRWMITAGEWKLDKARNTEQRRGLEHIVVHEKYAVDHSKEIEYINDIALIKLNRPLQFMFNPFVQPSLLPASNCTKANGSECLETHQDWAVMTDCFTTGWGKGTNGQVTNKGNTIQVAIDENANHEIIRSSKMPEEKIICMGYSGSPLMCDLDTTTMAFIPNQKMVVLGLNSYIYPSGCIKKHKNYIQTSLDYHLKWIADTVMDWIQWSPWSKCFKNNKRGRVRSGFFPEYGYLPGKGPLYQSYQRDVARKDEETCTVSDIKDKCLSDPCQNEGTCIDKGNSYTCYCKVGYTGVNCTDIGECDSSPCQNEGTCIDKVNGYTCKCKDGYAGVNCTVTLVKLKSKPIVSKRQLQSSRIYDLAVTSSGRIVTTGTATRIYASDYSLIIEIGIAFWEVTVTSDDQLAFTQGSNTIYFYTTDGTAIRQIAVKGFKAQLQGITTLSNGQLVVCDYKTASVYKVDPITGDSTSISKPGTFEYPHYVTTNTNGVIIVCDDSRDNIKGLDEAGNVLFKYGTRGSGQGQLHSPNGVYTDIMDFIVVADEQNHRIPLLTPEGSFHSYLLSKSDGLNYPNAVRINRDGQLLVGDHKGQLFTITYRE